MKQTKFFPVDFADPKRLAAVIIFFLAFFAFIWEVISGLSSTNQIKMETKTVSKASIQEPLKSDSPLFTTPLFGDYIPVNLSEAEIKQSMLDVEVVGIMYAEKEKSSQVILRVGGGKEESYVIGNHLPGGAIIKRITPEGIVVLHNGALESLSLPKSKLIFEVPAKPLIKE